MNFKIVRSHDKFNRLNNIQSGYDVDEWYHVVAVYDGFKAQLYVNSVLVAAANVSGLIRYAE